MLVRLLFISLIVFLFAGCRSEAYVKADRVEKFVREELNLPEDYSGRLVISLAGGCTSCDWKAEMSLINKICNPSIPLLPSPPSTPLGDQGEREERREKVIWVYTNASLSDTLLAQSCTNITYRFFDREKITEYGLTRVSSVYFDFTKGRISDWFYIREHEISEL